MRTWLRLLVLATLLTLAGAVHAQPAPAAPAPAAPTPGPASEEQRLAEAKAYFLRGVDHADRGEWDAALAEFLRSREILPTTQNTYNAAGSLRRVNRFDEALDMYEALLREFPNLSPQEKQVAQQEVAQLRASIGVVELRGAVANATITIDGRDRGVFPPTAPLRVGAGSHTVRVSADGYLPFEGRVDVAGTRMVSVNVQLVALTAGGRLHVSEQTGKALDVVVDNATVGKSPWEGLIAPGEHTVVLRGEGNVGTQPVLASVKLNQLAKLNLLAEQLDASVRIQPTPASANVTLDAIPIGRGVWEGRLRPGSHTVEVAADGYLPFKQELDLKKDATVSVIATLERDITAMAGPSAKLGLELDMALPIGVIFGGDLAATCTGSCAATLPLGFHGVIHGIYQAGSGFGVGVDVGYMRVSRSLTNRPAKLLPEAPGDPTNSGTADDTLRISGLTVGASAQYHRGVDWPVLLRLGVGALLGSVSDARSGTFTNSQKQTYMVSATETPSASYLYVAPELRIGRRFGEHFELNVGAEVLLMTGLSKPTWADQNHFLRTIAGTGRGDSLGTFPSQSVAGSFMLFIAPGLGARYEF